MLKRKINNFLRTKVKAFNKEKLIKNLKPTPKTLIFGGLVLFFCLSFIKIKDNLFPAPPLPLTSSSNINTDNNTAKKYFLPVRINIPKLNLNLPIETGGIKNNNWILNQKSIMFLDTSSLPGEGFNTVLYGHNYSNLLGSLKYLKTDDQIIIKTQDNKEYIYQVVESVKTKPSQVSQLKSDIPNTLTMFTCEGAFDQERLVLKAVLQKE